MEVTNINNITADQSKFENWRPQPYETTPYLADTTEIGSTEFEAYCAKGNYSVTDMSQYVLFTEGKYIQQLVVVKHL